jgi:hypothetical protein
MAALKSLKFAGPIIQLLTLLSALAINFLIPITYGIEVYGSFIQTNILVFVCHKFIDIINEPLISSMNPKYIFASSLFCSGFIYMLLIVGNTFQNTSSEWLLLVMLLSSSSMLSMFALKLKYLLIIHLSLVLIVFLNLITLDKLNIYNTSIVNLCIFSNLLPSLISILGILMGGAELPPPKDFSHILKTTLYKLPRNISTTFAFNCLTNFFPYLLAQQLSALDIGIFRVVTSLLQAATSVFPINTKSIFLALADGKNQAKQLLILMSGSLLYFSFIGLMVASAAYFFPRLEPYTRMVSFLPILFWAVLLERFTQVALPPGRLIYANLIVGVGLIISLLLITTLEQAELLYELGISSYLLLLAWCSRTKSVYLLIIFLLTFSALFILLKSNLYMIEFPYFIILAISPFIFMGFRFSDIKYLKI